MPACSVAIPIEIVTLMASPEFRLKSRSEMPARIRSAISQAVDAVVLSADVYAADAVVLRIAENSSPP